MQKYSPSDDFGSFLSAIQRATKQPTQSDTSTRIIHTLSRSKQVKVTHMAGQIKTSWSTFNQSLQSLQEAGLIKMQDDDEGGTLWLTQEGEHWAQAMNIDWNDSDDDTGEER